MAIKINFSGASEGFAPVKAGYYRAKAMSLELKTAGEKAKNPGSPYVEVVFQLLDRNNRRAWHNWSLLRDQLWRMKQDLVNAYGFDPEQFDEDFELDPDDVIDEEVILQLTVGSYQGRPSNNITAILPKDADVELAEEDEE